MSTDVASIMLPVSRGLMDRDRELDTMAGVHPNPGGAPAAVRGMKRGDPEPDGQTAAALVDSAGAECKRPRIDGTGGIGEVGQVREKILCPYTVMQTSPAWSVLGSRDFSGMETDLLNTNETLSIILLRLHLPAAHLTVVSVNWMHIAAV